MSDVAEGPELVVRSGAGSSPADSAHPLPAPWPPTAPVEPRTSGSPAQGTAPGGPAPGRVRDATIVPVNAIAASQAVNTPGLASRSAYDSPSSTRNANPSLQPARRHAGLGPATRTSRAPAEYPPPSRQWPTWHTQAHRGVIVPQAVRKLLHHLLRAKAATPRHSPGGNRLIPPDRA
jgi:hypothetical protein